MMNISFCKKPKEKPHAPRYPHDCGRCKYSWCCGPPCVCQIQLNRKYGKNSLPEAPMDVKLAANAYTHNYWKTHRPEDYEKKIYALPYPELEDWKKKK